MTIRFGSNRDGGEGGTLKTCLERHSKAVPVFTRQQEVNRHTNTWQTRPGRCDAPANPLTRPSERGIMASEPAQR